MANTKNKKYFIIKNRSTSRVVYQIPSLNIRHEFAPGESIRVSYEELKKFMYEPGARALIENFLQIEAEEILNEFNINTQPEYFLNEQQVKDLLVNGSLDAFLDCLDFAPIGVIDLIKAYAISLPLSDYNKRQALKEKIGFDVDKALEHKREEAAEVAEAAAPVEKSTRPRPTATPGRRTNANYKTTETK